MAVDRDGGQYVAVEYLRRTWKIAVDVEGTLLDAAYSIANATSTAPSTLKLVQGGRGCAPLRTPQQSLADSGLLHGKWLLLASSEADVSAVRSSKDLPGMASFEHEAARHETRRRSHRDAVPRLPTGPYTFGSFEAWEDAPLEVFPRSIQALALLRRLAGDPGIAAVMAAHRWSVGLLAEMPPEGFVGVSSVCILGYNTNRGQSIHLRLRTDDLKGFRRYQPIRDTLIHELAHNVWSDHDNRFKALNSQLQKEVVQIDCTRRGGHMLLGPAFETDDVGLGASPAAAPAAHVLGGSAAGAPVTVAAASAALRRSGNSIPPQQHLPLTELVGSAAAAPASADANAEEAPVSGIEGLGHRDVTTEAAEAAMASLSAAPARDSLADSAASPPESNATHEGGDVGCSATDALPATAANPLERSVAPAGSGVRGALRPAASPAALAASLTSELQPAAQCWVRPSGIQSTTESAVQQPSGSRSAASSAEAMNWAVPCSAALDAEPGLPPPAAVSAAAAPAGVVPVIDTAAATAAAEVGHTKHPLTPAASMHRPVQSDTAPGCSDGGEVQRRLARVQEALAALTATADPAQTRVALHSLQKILQNVLSAPQDLRMRRIRAQNSVFQSRIGSLPPAVDVLHLAGFEDVTEAEGTVLALRRDDPALVWLALSAVREQLVH